jgi:large subunit ribosomal protein L32e
MVQPLVRVKKVKKHPRQFKRFQSDRFMRVAPSWRKPRGIDCRVRRRFRGQLQMPSVGFRSAVESRDILPNGFRKILVKTEDDLNTIMMHNRLYCAELSHTLSSKTRKRLLEKANELDIKVTNANAKLRAEEN